MNLTLRNLARTATLAAGLWLSASTDALAQSWIGPLVALDMDEQDECRIEVFGNGRFYRFDAYGLEPGEVAQLVLLNEDLRPVERTVRVGQDGRWADYYLPGVGGRKRGVIEASLTGARCDLQVSFAWRTPSASPDDRPAWAPSHFPED